LSVNPHHARGVLRLLHAALDLQRSHTGMHNLRKQLNRTHILRAQNVLTVPAVEPAASLIDFIGQAAGLGASSSVAAPAAENTAEQALAGIAVAERPVYECLNFQIRVLADGRDLF